MTEQIKEYIQTAIGDGELEESEIRFLRKKAIELGDDPDEVIMVAKTENAKLSKQRKQSYVGEIKKCPNCGDTLPSMVSKCPSCGIEINDSKISRTSKLFETYSKIPDDEKSDFITSITLPNNKQELSELLIKALVNSKSSNAYDKKEGKDVNIFLIYMFWPIFLFKNLFGIKKKLAIIKAWCNKTEEIIERGKVMFSDDLTFQNYLDKQEKKLKNIKINNAIFSPKTLGAIIIVVIVLLYSGFFSYTFSQVDNSNTAQQIEVETK